MTTQNTTPMNAEECPRVNRWLFGCKFKPRFDTVTGTNRLEPEQIEALPLMFSDDVQKAIGVMAGHSKKYLGEVCVRCGYYIPAPR